MKNAVLITFSLFTFFSFSQNDSIVFNNGNYLVGKIKKLELGVLQIETEYSDSDFRVDWELIKYLKSQQIFMITMSNGDRYNGSLESTANDPKKINIQDEEDGNVAVNLLDITYLKTIDQTFLSRLDLLLSIGYNFTKANNNHQFNARINLGYQANGFSLSSYINTVESFQEREEETGVVKINTKRVEGGMGMRFYLVKDWFAMIKSDFLKSSEQQLDIRAVSKGGIGKLFVNNQRMYLLASTGVAWNYEKYANPDLTDRDSPNSAEGYLGLEYKIFDLGDLKLTTSLYGYPSFTESGRFRSDFLFDISYDLPLDLFVGIGFTLNYDNKPAIGSGPTDYVLQTSIGWEL